MNATQAEVPVMAMNAIAGWTGGYSGSREMLAYGSAALEGTAHLEYLFTASTKVHARLREKILENVLSKILIKPENLH